MGAGYHGGFGNTAGENKHKKAIGNRNPIHKRLIDENLIKELRKNNIRFSEKDIFYFEDSVQDCIMSILDRIEESDEFGSELRQEDLFLMIDKLQKNEEW